MSKHKSTPVHLPEPSSRERVEWLLAFLRGDSDFTSWRPGDQLNLRHDADRYLWPSLDGGFDLYQVMRDLHAELTRCLHGLADGLWTLRPPVIRSTVSLFVKRDGSVLRNYERPEPAAGLRAAAIDLLVEWFKEMRRCRQCKVWFLPRHGRQQFHDPACSTRARWQRFGPKRKRDYQAEYARKMKRKAPGAKVVRRPR